jgi:hypothetical protein
MSFDIPSGADLCKAEVDRDSISASNFEGETQQYVFESISGWSQKPWTGDAATDSIPSLPFQIISFFFVCFHPLFF